MHVIMKYASSFSSFTASFFGSTLICNIVTPWPSTWAASSPTPKVETITSHASKEAITGGGLIHPEHGTQARSVISRAFMDVQPPTATAFQLVSLLPGANVATSDPFGLSPHTNITVHGLNSDALGYILEGMPLNDVAYYGGYPSQFADTENYSQVALQQGSADIDSPVLNAAGGLMTLHFRDPSLKKGGYAAFSYGSYNTQRGFIRLETGETSLAGIRGFASYSNTHVNNWRGAGYDTRQHIDFKFLKEWGTNNRISLLGSWNKAITSYYPQVSLSTWNKNGIHAKNLAQHYPHDNAQDGTGYWRLWRDPEETLYVGAPLRLSLSNHLFLTATPYAQSAYGNFPSGSTLDTTGNYLGTTPITTPLNLPNAKNGTAVVRADYSQRSYRTGLNTALHVAHTLGETGQNELVFGYWHDYSNDNEQQPFTAVDAYGNAANIWADKTRNRVLLDNGQRLLGGSFHTMAHVNALFIGDHMHLFHDCLALDMGLKEVMLSRWGNNNLPGPQHHISSNSTEFLPRFGLRWSVTDSDQIFLNATTNFRAPAITAYYDSYALTSPELAGLGTQNLRNEYSIAEEIGYRRIGNWLTGSISFFNYNFTNRQITTLIAQHDLQMTSSLNAGGQTSRGADIELGTKPLFLGSVWGGKQHISPYISFEYLHATIDNNLPAGNDFLPTKGKTAVRSPHIQAAIGLRYSLSFVNEAEFFGMITTHYTSQQYASFMNDEQIPSYTTTDLSLGYRFGEVSFLHHPGIQLNFLNISNQHYLSGVDTTQLNAHDVRGVHGSLVSGQAPKHTIGGSFATLFTASTGF